MSIENTEKLVTCPYCRKVAIHKTEVRDNEIRLRCIKCKMTIEVRKINKNGIQVI